MPQLISTTEKKLKGTLRKCRVNIDEPFPEEPFPVEPPTYFTRDERSCWRELCRMTVVGVLTGSDRWIAELACQLMAKLRRREPLSSAELSQLVACIGRMGLTPVDRAKVHVTKPPEPKDDFGFLQ